MKSVDEEQVPRSDEVYEYSQTRNRIGIELGDDHASIPLDTNEPQH